MCSLDSVAKIRTFIETEQPAIALTTVSGDGHPSTVLDPEITFTRDGKILYREYLESSETNRNLLFALWFEKRVLLALATRDTAIDLLGTPTHAHVAGALFQEHYEAARRASVDADLAAVWEIQIDGIADKSLERLRTKQDIERPFFRHLDRLVSAAE